MSNWLHRAGAAAFYILLVYAALLLFAVNYQAIIPGLDPSWAFALNHFAHGPEIFGRDLVLTYGPLAYLAVPQHAGANLQIVRWRYTLPFGAAPVSILSLAAA